MTSLNTAAVSICICCVICSILSLIFPNGTTEKIMNLLLGAFLVCSMLIPMLTFISSFSIESDVVENSFEYKDDYYSYEKEVLSTTAKNLVVVTNDFLASENISANDIKISIKKSENNSIYISSIYIYISDEYKGRIDEIKRIVLRNMSKEPVVIVNE